MNFFSLFKRNLIYKFKSKINIDKDGIVSKNLDDLFHHYGSDKANFFKKNQTTGHGYSKYYVDHFAKIKKHNINILEIGSYSGASAAAFAKFLPNSTICCLDINISNFSFFSKNIRVFGLDIRNEKKLEKTLNKIKKDFKIDLFDIIIDDGSHNLSDILITIKSLFKYLNNFGLYVIEDYKYPNYHDYNKDVDDILIDQLIENIKKKIFFNSEILDRDQQKVLFENVRHISTYKGNLKDSDICFIEKK